jgi:DNA invertase Pin-like site-specific DNA recombinase
MMLANGVSVSTIAETTGLTRQTIHRIQANPVQAVALLVKWEARPPARHSPK